MAFWFRTNLLAGWLLSAATLCLGAGTSDELFTPEQLEFFEAKVRPLLVQHCFECHSARTRSPKGRLRLDSRALCLEGGESGAAVVPGKPDESPLVAAIRWQSLEMPPRGKLQEREIATLVTWIEMGAPWPPGADHRAVPAPASDYDWQRWRREHWSFQPVIRPPLPDVGRDDWLQTPVDRFVLARLEQEGLRPAPPADPRALVRRIFFDLLGLPPTSEQADDFVLAAEQNRETAVNRLVDQLLASPHYGERWGRHWLDVARYSDGYGGFLDNATYSEAWRYRDWVVDAFNSDLPFDRFLRFQIAGDLSGNRRDAIATGFFALGPNYISDGGDPDSVAQARAETLADRLDTLGQGMLGLTIACARCHDHKFDPLPQQDYYSLAGVFNNTTTQEHPLAPDEVVQTFKQHQQMLADTNKRIGELQNQIRSANRAATEPETQQLSALQARLAELQASAPPPYEFAHSLRDVGSADMPVAIRGNLRQSGQPAPRRFLRVLAGDQAPLFQDGSGRRQLAEAVTDRANPLTARVFVNRLWMHHFGQGLVRTPNNFGALGETPTHPQLLDWLAATFIENPSIKALQRTIILSATYQMGSDFDARAFAHDGDNRMLWRMSPRRLDAEAWRDALLSVTGEFDGAVGGPPTTDIASRRRTLYLKVSRNGDVFPTDEFLRLFDFPLMRAPVARRTTSIVPQQFLFLLNSPFMIQRSQQLAQRLAQSGGTDESRIRTVYPLLYQRPATAAEIDVGLSFLRETPSTGSQLSAWEQYAQALLGANEFMYLR